MRLGSSVGRTVAGVTGHPADAKRAQRLLGVGPATTAFQFREPTHLTEREVRGARRAAAEAGARPRCAARGRNPRLHVLLTGATGFLGKEILVQAADDRASRQVVAVVRPETIRDPKTKEVVKVLSPRSSAARCS